MKLAYKLTDQKGQTYGGTQWGERVTHRARGSKDGPLCSGSWIHGYESPYLAVLMNPIYGDFKDPLLWEFKGGRVSKTDGTKTGWRSGTTIRRIPLPLFTMNQRIAFGIFCAKEVYKGREWNAWAYAWLDGIDRTGAAAVEALGAEAWAWATSVEARAAAAAGAALEAAWAARAAGAAGAARAATCLSARAALEAAEAWADAKVVCALAEQAYKWEDPKP